MKIVPVEDPPIEDLGPHMRACEPQERRFIVAMIRSGGKSGAKAAEAAGYSNKGEACKVRAHELMHRPRVLKALQEEADRHLDGTAIIARLRLRDDVLSNDKKTRAWAVDSVLDRKGLGRGTVADIRVEHTDSRSTAELLALVRRIAPAALPAPIEGSFEEVKEPAE